MSVLKQYERRRARKMQEKAYKTDERRAQLQAMRSSVQQIRQAQIQRAEIMQMGENRGVSGSDSVLGGMYSVQSQATSNIAFGQQIFGLQQSAGRMRMAANKHMSNAQAIGALQQAVMPMFAGMGSSGGVVPTGSPSWSQGGGQEVAPSPYSNQVGFFG